MATSVRELLGWTEQRWAAVQDAVDRTLARTAMCRKVVPKGPEQLGATTVAVPVVQGGGIAAGAVVPYEFDTDKVIAPVALMTRLRFDDQQGTSEPSLLRLFESAAAELGKFEDERIVKGSGGKPREATLVPKKLTAGSLATTTNIPAALDADALLSAVATAVGLLDTANRPGPCGLLLNSGLYSLLRRPTAAGESSPLPQVEALLGSNEIAGTPALAGAAGAAGAVCGLIFRIEPPAVDLVHTKLPTITYAERTGAVTMLQIEEEIALRILDPAAVVRLLHS